MPLWSRHANKNSCNTRLWTIRRAQSTTLWFQRVAANARHPWNWQRNRSYNSILSMDRCIQKTRRVTDHSPSLLYFFSLHFHRIIPIYTSYRHIIWYRLTIIYCTFPYGYFLTTLLNTPLGDHVLTCMLCFAYSEFVCSSIEIKITSSSSSSLFLS